MWWSVLRTRRASPLLSMWHDDELVLNHVGGCCVQQALCWLATPYVLSARPLLLHWLSVPQTVLGALPLGALHCCHRGRAIQSHGAVTDAPSHAVTGRYGSAQGSQLVLCLLTFVKCQDHFTYGYESHVTRTCRFRQCWVQQGCKLRRSALGRTLAGTGMRCTIILVP
jgi:hypothetical protein